MDDPRAARGQRTFRREGEGVGLRADEEHDVRVFYLIQKRFDRVQEFSRVQGMGEGDREGIRAVVGKHLRPDSLGQPGDFAHRARAGDARTGDDVGVLGFCEHLRRALDGFSRRGKRARKPRGMARKSSRLGEHDVAGQ